MFLGTANLHLRDWKQAIKQALPANLQKTILMNITDAQTLQIIVPGTAISIEVIAVDKKQNKAIAVKTSTEMLNVTELQQLIAILNAIHRAVPLERK